MESSSETDANRRDRVRQQAVVADLQADDQFSGSELLTSHDVRSGVVVPVGPPDDPWGVLGTDATTPRAFTHHDATFVRSVANVLASAIEKRGN